MTEILKAENICKSYKMGQATLDVLKGVDFSVKKGEFVAITGASGSGKSTILHILGALDKPDTGSVSFQGTDLKKFKTSQLNKLNAGPITIAPKSNQVTRANVSPVPSAANTSLWVCSLAR